MFSLVIMSGPSGVGKTTLSQAIVSKYSSFIISTSATTRKIRPGEVDGKNYFFITTEIFEKYIQEDNFLEYIKIFDNYYGTLKSFIFDNIKNKNIILDIDYIGAIKIKNKIEEYNKVNTDKIGFVSIFIKPNSVEDLYRRLEKRGEQKSSIETRIKRAQEELSNSYLYDFCLENNIFEDSVEQIEQILKAKKLI